MRTTTLTKQEKIKYINAIIVLFFMFGFQFIPPVSSLTSTGMHVLGIFIGCVYGWSTVDLIWTGFFAVISMSFVEGYNLNSVVAAGFGSSTFWILVFMVLFVMVFECAGGTKFISSWLLARKILKGKPLLFTFVFLFATFMVGMLNPIASVILFFSILFQICGQVGYEDHSKYSVVMMIGVIFASMFGSISHSLMGTPLTLSNAFTAATGIQLSVIDFVKVGWPFSVFLLVVFTLSVKYVFRCDLKPLADVKIEEIINVDAMKASPQLKAMAVFIVILVLGLVGGAALPATMKFTQILNALNLLGICMILLGVMTFVKINNEYLFDFKKYVNALPWDVLFITAAIMPLSSMLTMEGTGIDTFISSILGDKLAALPPTLFIAAIMFVGIILTNFANNAAICILLMPVILSVCASSGLSSIPIYMSMIFAVHLALLTPGACPYAAMLWGETKHISPKDIYKYAPIIMIIFYICILFVGYNWAKLMLG